MTDYTKFCDKSKGQIGFVLTSGSSLHKISTHKHFSKIFEYPTIVINSAILLTDWSSGRPDDRYWVGCDCGAKRWTYWRKANASQCYKVVKIESWRPYLQYINKCHTFHERTKPVAEKETGLVGCSSGPAGIDFAIQLGLSKIFLLGFDGCVVDKKTHFWQHWRKAQQPRLNHGLPTPLIMQKRLFHNNKNAYPELLNFSRNKNSEIIDCSPVSIHNVFKKMKFEDVIDDVL